MRDLLVRFLQYNHWANECLLATAEQLTAEELHSGTLSHGTAFLTLRHLLAAEVSWRMTCLGESVAPEMHNVELLTDLASVEAYWQVERQRLLDLIQTLPEEDFERKVEAHWRQRHYTIREVVLHVVNHASNHRSELGWYFTALGHSPGELEFVDFIDILWR